jgi:Uncharacterized protein conserved in bacteria (DUF2171)
MAHVDRESIQPGWVVYTSDGQELGRVIDVEQDALVVKKGGLLGGEVMVPKAEIEDTETGRVDVSLTKSELP